MSEETKDTLNEAAPEGIPATQETQGESQESGTVQTAPPTGTPERTFAGKFKSAEELEKAYLESQSLIGKKEFSEKIGESVVQATGYTVAELKAANYTEEEIVQAMLEQKTNAYQTQNTIGEIQRTVESVKVESLQFELELDRLERKHPEAAEMKDWIQKMKKHPDYRDKSAQDIFNELQPLMKKGEDAAYQRQSEKEKASMSISNSSIPQTDESKKHLERYKQSGRLEDAADFISARLFKNK